MKGLIQIPGPFTGLDQYSYLPLVRPPALSTWTQASAANATFTDDPKWGLGLYQAKNPAQLCLLTRPVAVPYTVTVAVLPLTGAENFATWLFLVGDGTKLEGWNWNQRTWPNAPSISKWTNIATFLSDAFAAQSQSLTSPIWLQIAEDALHRTFSLSPDGSVWVQFFQEAAATYLTTSLVGIGLATSPSRHAALRLLSWSGA